MDVSTTPWEGEDSAVEKRLEGPETLYLLLAVKNSLCNHSFSLSLTEPTARLLSERHVAVCPGRFQNTADWLPSSLESAVIRMGWLRMLCIFFLNFF